MASTSSPPRFLADATFRLMPEDTRADRDRSEHPSRARDNPSHDHAAPLQRATGVATAAGPCGHTGVGARTLYGRLLLDVSKFRSQAWKIRRNGDNAAYVRDFLTPSCTAAYAYAEAPAHPAAIPDPDHQAAGALASLGLAPCITKLYLMPATPGRRRRILTLAGRHHLVLPATINFHDRIPLAATYDEFLATLGGHSRRNLRHARRNAAQAGITHTIRPAAPCLAPKLAPSLALNLAPSLAPDLAGLAARTYPTGFRQAAVQAIHRLLAAQAHGFHSLIAAPDGDIISCCSGFIDGDTAFVIHQMNHRDHLAQQPSLTNRGFLIEHLIERGVKNLVFIKGCRGILHHACLPESGDVLWIVRLSPRSLLVAAMLLAQFPLLDVPGKIRAFVYHLARGTS